MSKIIKTHAHGKVILIGEHSVVYKYGALVAPFSHSGIEVVIEPRIGEIEIESSYHTGSFFKEGAPIEGLQTLVDKFLSKYRLPRENFKITIKSTLLSRRGLGSSAAVAKAVAEALFQYFDLPYSREQLIEFIQESELVYHFKPSGIDMNAVLSDDLLFYKDGVFETVSNKFPLNIVVVDSGTPSQTRISVSEVALKVKNNDQEVLRHLARLGELALEAKSLLTSGRLENFALTLKEAQTHLKAIGVSSDELDRLIEIAYEHGAMAAKLTGGGQGGCMFALFENEAKALQFATMIHREGYEHSWVLRL